ncbi:DUF445 domain-containing protein [Nocardioidaceae bacterium]|nr:DUF445 domain-containing protein [Nocardioidaceae bacterium]
MRLVATGLLALAAVVFVLTRDTDGWLGFVNAAAEAGMVGAIADWFAVTALFRHPLGVPVPHTALVPRRKAELGRSLQDFVADNFLVEDVVRERVLASEPTLRACEWLSVEANAERAADEAAHLAGRALDRLRPEDVRSVVEDVILPRLREEPAAEVLGALLAQVVADRSHVGVVDLVVAEALRWLELHEETFIDVVSERAPWWAPTSLNDKVVQRLHLEVVRWLQDIARDPHHHARYALDSLLAQVAEDLQRDPDTQASAERLKLRLLEQPQLVDSGMAVWGVLERSFRDALEDREGPVRSRLTAALVTWARTTAGDAGARARFDRRAADAVVYAVQRYGTELTSVITTTVERWDGREAADRIELHVGRDLQFIRINGTVVGGLVGIVIHAVGILLP